MYLDFGDQFFKIDQKSFSPGSRPPERNFSKKWVKQNPKQDGEQYDIYRDGLKIYTTIDSRHQKIAEMAVKTHMSNLQKEFFKQNIDELNPTAPFLDLREGQIDTLLNLSAKRSERWRVMKLNGKSEQEIKDSFKKPTPPKLIPNIGLFI